MERERNRVGMRVGILNSMKKGRCTLANVLMHPYMHKRMLWIKSQSEGEENCRGGWKCVREREREREKWG